MLEQFKNWCIPRGIGAALVSLCVVSSDIKTLREQYLRASLKFLAFKSVPEYLFTLPRKYR